MSAADVAADRRPMTSTRDWPQISTSCWSRSRPARYFLETGEVQRVRGRIEEVPTSVIPPRVLDVEAQHAGIAHDLKKAIHDQIIPRRNGNVCSCLDEAFTYDYRAYGTDVLCA